jgi:hypothetical protein
VVLVIHHFVPHLKAVPVEMQILVLQVMALVVVVVRGRWRKCYRPNVSGGNGGAGTSKCYYWRKPKSLFMQVVAGVERKQDITVELLEPAVAGGGGPGWR